MKMSLDPVLWYGIKRKIWSVVKTSTDRVAAAAGVSNETIRYFIGVAYWKNP
jgi:hypothetical protein